MTCCARELGQQQGTNEGGGDEGESYVRSNLVKINICRLYDASIPQE